MTVKTEGQLEYLESLYDELNLDGIQDEVLRNCGEGIADDVGCALASLDYEILNAIRKAQRMEKTRMTDYREAYPDYVCEPAEPRNQARMSQCPACRKFFKTPDFDVSESREGDEFFGICPECGGLMKLEFYFTYGFDEHPCTPEQFRLGIGESVPKEADDEA